MTFGAMECELAGETVQLLPERALYWPRRKTLVIADVHWGKAAAFRKASVPVPGGTTAGSLNRLDDVLAQVQVDRILILGDLFHARAGRSDEHDTAVTFWRDAHRSLHITLVRGNHDRRSGDPPGEWAMTVVNEAFLEEPFAFRHHPQPTESYYTLAGHLHPAIRLRAATQERLWLPCFWFGAGVGVLPSFGDFTGRGDVALQPGDRCFAIAKDEVVPLPMR
ncbi:MAG: ligase-associated DNA damage response endonuclease PdeM [Gemmataceae bacterium]